MRYDHFSPKVYLLFEDERIVEFQKYPRVKPSIDECKGKIKGICFSYAFCGEQDFGIAPLLKAFNASNEDGIINNVPLEDGIINNVPLKVETVDKVKALMYYPYGELDREVIKGTKLAGITGYWDKSRLVICAAPEYDFIIDAIMEMIKPQHTCIGLNSQSPFDTNLVILAV